MKNGVFLIIFNSLFWIIIHMISGYLSHLIPETIYRPSSTLFKPQWWEKNGKIYEKLFLIKRWKDKLPEAGEFFRLHPFNKKHLLSTDPAYLNRFLLETCRAEMAHLLPIVFLPLSFPFNPPIGDSIMALYAFLANIPFIMIQRYNRIRLLRIASKKSPSR